MNKEQAAHLELVLSKIEDLFSSESFRGTFDMDHWGLHEREHAPAEQNFCGTSACLAGWMAFVDPDGFGQRAEWIKGKNKSSYLSFHHISDDSAKYFGLTMKQEEELFMKGFNISLKDKIAQARSFIKEGDK